MTILNPKRNADGSITVDWDHPKLGLIPFTASPNDPEKHGRDIYTKAEAGEFGPVAPYVEPPPEPTPVPQEVTMRQARLALLSAGLLADVTAFMDAIADPVQREAAHIEWEYAQTVSRDNPLINAFAQSQGMTEVAVDALFVSASEI